MPNHFAGCCRDLTRCCGVSQGQSTMEKVKATALIRKTEGPEEARENRPPLSHADLFLYRSFFSMCDPAPPTLRHWAGHRDCRFNDFLGWRLAFCTEGDFKKAEHSGENGSNVWCGRDLAVMPVVRHEM